MATPLVSAPVVRRPGLRLLALATLILVGRAPPALSDVVQCKGGVLMEGMTREQVLAKCGPPNDIKRVENAIIVRNLGGGVSRPGVVVVEYWTYRRDKGEFPVRVTIDEGVATEVRRLSTPKDREE